MRRWRRTNEGPDRHGRGTRWVEDTRRDLYGLVAHWVQQRSREIGVRLALGAGPFGIGAMVVRQGMRLATVGVGIGIAGALGLAQPIRGLLFGVPANDPAVFGSIPLLLSLVALAAVSIPAASKSNRAVAIIAH
jgi:ABC-type antimicrobial peptide transport system permease subunit